MGAVRSKDTMVTDQIDARFGDQRGEPGHEVQGPSLISLSRLHVSNDLVSNGCFRRPLCISRHIMVTSKADPTIVAALDDVPREPWPPITRSSCHRVLP